MNENDKIDGLVKCVSKMSDAMKTLLKHEVELNTSKNIKKAVYEEVRAKLQAELSGIYNAIAELEAIVLNVREK